MVETELGFLQVQIEGVSGDAVELEQALFGEAPEALDAVDMARAGGELVVSVVDPEMCVEVQIDQAVVAPPAVGVQHRCGAGLAADNGLQRGFGSIGHDLGVEVIATFQQAEDDGSPARPPGPVCPVHGGRQNRLHRLPALRRTVNDGRIPPPACRAYGEKWRSQNAPIPR